MFLGWHFKGRQPGVQGCFRCFGVFFDKDGRLIDIGAANAAKDYEGGYFFADFAPLFGLGMERTPGRGPADDGIERSLATAIGAAGHCKGRQEACMGHFLLVWDTGAIVSS